jgi:hypothetical protein
VVKDDLMLRVAPDDGDALLKQPGARAMDFMPSRPPPKGFIMVAPSALKTEAQLTKWVGRGVAYAGSLPPKAAKKRKAKR